MTSSGIEPAIKKVQMQICTCAVREGVWNSGCIAPRIFGLETGWSEFSALRCRHFTPVTYITGFLMCCTLGLDALEKDKRSSVASARFLWRQRTTHSLYRLPYRGTS